MKQPLVLSSEELFIAGKQMQARYLDYEYVAAMRDLTQNYAMKKKDILFSLEEKGVLEEDFAGDIEMDAQAQLLLEPIFFGMNESEIRDGETICKFHFYGGRVTRVDLTGRKLSVCEGRPEMVDAWADRLIPAGYDRQKEVIAASNEDFHPLRTVLLRNTSVGQRAHTAELAFDGTAWYARVDSERILALDEPTIRQILMRLLWEE